MGKGQRRRLKRAREAGEEYENARLKEEERKEMEDLPDHDLFFLDKEDRTSKTKRSRAEKKVRLFGPQHAHSLTTPSLHEAKKIAELAKRLEAGGVDQSLVTTSKTRRRKGKGEQGVAVYDIWGEDEKEEEEDKGKKKNGKRRVVYKPLAPADLPLSRPQHPGQSYNPTLEDHQDLLKKAVEVEEAREEAIKEAKKPVATTVSETMLAVMVGSSDEEENEEGDYAEDKEQGGLTMKKKKEKGKLTKTERNRLRRRKEQEHLEKQRKAQKSLLKQVEAASQLAKKVNKKSQAVEAGKAGHHQRPRIKPREAKPVVLPDELNPIKAKSVEVLLSEEVSGELRLVRPEGDLAKESFDNLKKRGWIEKGGTKKISSARSRPSRRVKYLDKYRG